MTTVAATNLYQSQLQPSQCNTPRRNTQNCCISITVSLRSVPPVSLRPWAKLKILFFCPQMNKLHPFPNKHCLKNSWHTSRNWPMHLSNDFRHKRWLFQTWMISRLLPVCEKALHAIIIIACTWQIARLIDHWWLILAGHCTDPYSYIVIRFFKR